LNDFVAMSLGTLDLVYFWCSEADRLWEIDSQTQSHQLKSGYTGRVCDSSSTMDSDKDAILAEIDDSIGQHTVDETIQVLLMAGLSTPSLRAAHKKGVDISCAGRVRLKYCWLALANWIVQITLIPRLIDTWRTWVSVASLVMLLTWILYCCMANLDHRAFAVSAAFKLHVTLLVQLEFCVVTLNYWSVPVCCLIMDAIIILVSGLGPGGVATLPCIGPWLTQFILAGTWRQYQILLTKRLFRPALADNAPSRTFIPTDHCIQLSQ